MAWLAAGREGLDDEHAAATARTRLGEWLRRRRIDLDRLLGHRRGQTEELACSRDRLGAIAGGEQAVVTDAMEAVGQDVEEKATDELVRGKPHDAAAAAAAIILIGERHLIVIDGDKSRIGDRGAMRVAGAAGRRPRSATSARRLPVTHSPAKTQSDGVRRVKTLGMNRA